MTFHVSGIPYDPMEVLATVMKTEGQYGNWIPSQLLVYCQFPCNWITWRWSSSSSSILQYQ